jgi:Cu-Zn family superoxide dismutase
MYLLIIFISIIFLMYKYLKYKEKYTQHKKGVAVFEVNGSGQNSVIYLTTLPNEKTEIKGIIYGLNPNQEHAIHIHETGDLSEGCDSCCAHYNPENKKHGGPNAVERHVGDLGNVRANSEGIAEFKIIDSLVKVYAVIGRSFIVHADPDDFGLSGHSDSLTTGHAGKRIGCGVIGIAKNC